MIDYEKHGLLVDPETGNVYKITQLGANVDSNGYINVKLDGFTHKVHRLIWEYKYGPIPEGMQIDHINGVRNDNRIGNLRLATRLQNSQNRKKRTDNSSGATGVTYNKSTGFWVARIGIDGERVYLGSYRSKEEAQEVRRQAKAAIHAFNPKERDE